MPAEPQPEQPDASHPNERAAAIGRLFQEHNRVLVNFLTARLRSEAEARDVAQEAYVRLLQLDRPGAISFLRAYLFRIATNLATDRLRARGLRERLAEAEQLGDPLTEPSAERHALALQELELVQRSLPELPPKCREVFLLHVLDGLSTEQIGVRLGMTRRMARLHVVRALVFLRRKLERPAGELRHG